MIILKWESWADTAAASPSLGDPALREPCPTLRSATPQRDAGASSCHKRGRASPPLPDPRFAGLLGRRSGAHCAA
ncbi:MAG TPA: hypothetical protein VF780_00880 [Nitrosospira sp.]